jgi:hypothetical protein
MPISHFSGNSNFDEGKGMKRVILILLIGAVCIGLLESIGHCAEETKTFIAFSLKAAEKCLREGNAQEKETVLHLGYLNRIVGLIVDPLSKDCILIGERDPSLPELYLEDLVVMLRSVFLYGDKEAPGVTIDMGEQNSPQMPQKVRYFGHIENTRAGLVCFKADLLMKKIGLGLEPARVEGIQRYFDLAVMEAKKRGGERTDVFSRFWYYPVITRVVTVGNGVLIDQCELAVLTETLSAYVNGEPVENLEKFYDKPSELFAQSFTDHFDQLANSWPVIRDLRSLCILAAVSRGLAKTDVQPDIHYWLYDYQLPYVETPTEVDVLRNAQEEIGLEIYGGVYLQSLSMRLKEGDLTAFSEAVLEGRPSLNALFWSVVVTSEKQIVIPNLPVDTSSAVEAYCLADYLYQAGQYDLAIAYWFEVARTYPQMGEVYYRIAQAFERKGLMSCAADYYTRALKLDPFFKAHNKRKE